MAQCPRLVSPTLEAQARHPAVAPRPCWPHDLEEKEEKKPQTGRTPKQMAKAKLSRQNHTKKHTHTHSL